MAVWLGWAAISMHQFEVMRLGWWLYHFILLLAFLYTIYVLVRAYERARQFSLVRYYVAVSLIATALLALLASSLFAEFAYRNFVAQIESVGADHAEHDDAGDVELHCRLRPRRPRPGKPSRDHWRS